MKKVLLFLVMAFFALNLYARENRKPVVTIPGVIHSEGYVFIPFERDGFNINMKSEGERFETDKVELEVPEIKLAYEPVTPKIGGGDNWNRILKTRSKIVVKTIEPLQDSPILDKLDMHLLDMGFDVINHSIIKGMVSVAEIRDATGADYIIDLSWLGFSDPEMWTSLKSNGGLIVSGQPKISAHMWDRLVVKEKDYNKWTKKRKGLPKRAYSRPLDYSVIDCKFHPEFSLYDDLMTEISESDCFKTNKNVISANFKLVDARTGSLLGSIKVGQQDVSSAVIPSGDSFTSITRNNMDIKGYDAWSKERAETGQWLCAWPSMGVLRYLSQLIPTEAIPYASKLNNQEDVKIGDERIVEQGNYSSTSSTRSSGRAYTDYYRYFNRSYYTGNSNTRSHGSSSTTTTFKDAEWLRCSDFYGYYTPLIDKFIAQLAAIRGTEE